jgi:hypothetical protein
MLGLRRCFTFGGLSVGTAVARELLRAVEPMAIEAAQEVERMQGEQQRIVELERQQRHESSLAERRYATCDPDNRLIAAQLEKSWEAALRRVEACEARLKAVRTPDPAAAPDFAGLAEDLDAAWNAPGVTMRACQRLLRALLTDIIADVDEAAREVVLTIHWRGGQHSQLRVRKPKSGEHGCHTPEEALAAMRSMATLWSDEDIAASLNRMGVPLVRERPGRRTVSARCGRCTGSTPTVPPRRMANGSPCPKPRQRLGSRATASDGSSRTAFLPAEQVVPGAPYQIRASDLHSERVTAAIARIAGPYRAVPESQLAMFTET